MGGLTGWYSRGGVGCAIGVLVVLGVVACSGDKAANELPTPTAGPSATEPRADPGVTGMPVLPRSGPDAGRADCPDNWLAYAESAFSICYPRDHHVEIRATSQLPAWLSIRLIRGEPLAFTPNILTVQATDSYDPPDDCLFQAEQAAVPEQRELGTIDLGNGRAFACTARLGGAIQFRGAAQTETGSLVFWSQTATDEQFELVEQILSTLRGE